MHCTITTTTTRGEPIEVARIVGDEMTGWLRDLEGFEGFLLLVQDKKALGLAFWASREIAERYATTRAEFRERMLAIAGADIQGVEEYELAFASLGAGLIAAGAG